MLKKFVFNIYDVTKEKQLLKQKAIYAEDMNKAYEYLLMYPKHHLKDPFRKVQIEFLGEINV